MKLCTGFLDLARKPRLSFDGEGHTLTSESTIPILLVWWILDEMEVYDNKEEEDDEDVLHSKSVTWARVGGDSDEEMQKKGGGIKGNPRRTTLLMKMTMSCLRIIMSRVSGVQRWVQAISSMESKKFKRFKKAHRDHHSGLSGGNEFDRSGRDLLQHSLFGDDEGEEQLEEDNELGDEDNLGNFIAEEDLDKHGAPMRRGVTKKKA
ncbi:hypothetical protein ACET3Z_001522 [Daucus carota]